MNIFGGGVERMTADSTAPDISHGNFIPHQHLDCASAFHLTRRITVFRLSASHSDSSSTRRKRKKSFLLDDDDIEDSDSDDSKSVKTDVDSKSNSSSRPSNHSEIEKRRRDKMNRYISEISALVPVCAAMSRKLDKLTVMRYGVQHIKTLRGCLQTTGDGTYKPSYLTEEELKEMLEQEATGFVLVVSCDRGRILHVSESVESVLGWTTQDITGKCCFDFVMKEDALKLKEQMSTAFGSETLDENQGTESVSSSTNNVVGSLSCFCPGSRREFSCRMRPKLPTSLPAASTPQGRAADHQKKFVSLRCSGYLKAWPPALTVSQQDIPSSSAEPESMPNFTCLVLLATPLKFTRSSAYPDVTVRLNLDGTFNFCDQDISALMGFLPQEIQCRSYYDFVHSDDLEAVSKLHTSALSNNTDEKPCKGSYRLRTSAGSFVLVQAEWSCFINPWNSEMEFLVVVVSQEPQPHEESANSVPTSSTLKSLLTKLPNSYDMEGKRTGTKLGAGKIGEMIADSHVRTQSEVTGMTSSGEDKKAEQNSPAAVANKQLGQELNGGSGNGRESRQNNDEATMSVLMSLLDADGGLGGNVDFTQMPWPL